MILICYNDGKEVGYNFDVGRKYTLSNSTPYDEFIEIYGDGDVVSYYFKNDTWKDYFKILDKERDLKINKLLKKI